MTFGRYYSDRDRRFINSVNRELIGDIIQCLVDIHKLCPDQSKINMYGESAVTEGGKVFFPGVSVTTLVDKRDIETTADEFGTDRKQIIQFRFRELTLKDFNLFPEVGDIIIYNDRLHEVVDRINYKQ